MFSRGIDVKILTKEEILENLNQIELLSYYLGITKLPCLINSPLREDKNPSFGIRTVDNDKIQFMDFKTAESGDIFHLLGLLWNKNFKEVLEKISLDINKQNVFSVDYCKTKYKNKNIKSTKIILETKVRDFKDYDLEYWSQYGISKEWLEFGDIYAISHIIAIKDNKRYIIPADKYAYVYIENKDNQISLKIYQPFNKKNKWLNNNDSSVWELWGKLPNNGESLIITSSRKDALCIWANTGIPSISLQSETYMPKPHIIQQLKDRFKNIYILYDNDFTKESNTGYIESKKISELFGLKLLVIPEYYNEKDISDICKKYGGDKVNKLIKILINKYE